MLTSIFPIYLFHRSIINEINYEDLNKFIANSAIWNLIKSSNNRDDDVPKTDKMGRLWDNLPLDAETLLPVFDIIRSITADYYKEIKCELTATIESAWVHDYQPNQAIDWHNHRGAETVGVLYLQNYYSGGEIEFLDPKEYALQNEPMHSIRTQEYHKILPSKGDLILFPGYLKHRSLPGVGGVRRVLGFHVRSC
ncbi:MAG: hypothetical protein EBX50_09620 [Chitinophagia bacterium]|nr:hypothetical protein [Chitinophagia bacterium]